MTLAGKQYLRLRLATTLRDQIESIAGKDGMSIQDFIALAIAEKLSRAEHQEWLLEQGLAEKRIRGIPDS